MTNSPLKRIVASSLLICAGVISFVLGYDLLAILCALAAIYVFPIKRVIEDTAPNADALPLVTQGSVMVDGKPTQVLVIDNSFIEKVKTSDRGKNPDTIFKKLHPSKFQLLK